MASVIKIKKGLDINLKGKAPDEFVNVGKSESYAVVPDNFNGFAPKVVVHPGDKVKAGSPLLIDKVKPDIKFVSPVSGEVIAVNRGEKRKILSVTVKPDGESEYVKFDVKNPADYDRSELKALLLESGLWPFFRQRPYDRIADPSVEARDIFVTAYDTAPLATDFDFIVKGEEDALQTGIDALMRLTDGKVYLGVKPGSALASSIKGVEIVELYGPHPVGNAGVIINNIKPVNKGETVYTISAPDLLYIGRFLKTGHVDFTRAVALAGPEFKIRGYAKVTAGCTIGSLVDGKLSDGVEHIRLISGNVLTGVKVGLEDYLGAYNNQITAIPEGDNTDEFLGWATPGFGKYSVSRSYLAWLSPKKKEWVIDARIKGGKRAMIMSNEYEKVFPMDIMPEYLLKAVIAFDIDKMENLGIYEVAPEDFALCEFVDTSKIELQSIVRNGLDLLYKEMN